MKRTVLFLVLLYLYSCSSVDDNSTAENLGRTYLSAVINQTPDILKDKVFTEASAYKEFNSKHMGRWNERWEERLPKAIEDANLIPQSVIRVKDVFKQYGLTDWSDVKFEKITFKDNTQNGAVMYWNVYVDFTNGDYLGSIKLGSIAQTNKGWLLLNMPEAESYQLNAF